MRRGFSYTARAPCAPAQSSGSFREGSAAGALRLV